MATDALQIPKSWPAVSEAVEIWRNGHSESIQPLEISERRRVQWWDETYVSEDAKKSANTKSFSNELLTTILPNLGRDTETLLSDFESIKSSNAQYKEYQFLWEHIMNKEPGKKVTL